MNSMIEIFGYQINAYAVSILIFIGALVIAIFRGQKNNTLQWSDMITRDGTKVSTTKLLQLLGGVVGTWVIIKLTLTKELSTEIFAIYLTYVASIDGYSKFIMAKYGASGSDDSAVPFKKAEDK